MPLLAVGLDLRRTSPALFERASFGSEELTGALRGIGRALSEVAILSTCTRVEVYAVAERYHDGIAALRRFLVASRGLAEDDLAGHLERFGERRAAEHLFAVASGIDSIVVGEPQILAQVRRAGRVAQTEGEAGPVLSELFRRAVHIGRRARAETAIGRGGGSLAHAAVALGAPVSGRTALVVGAGEIGSVAASELARLGARVLVCNRTPDRAETLAARLGGESVAWEEMKPALARADFVVSSTSGSQPVITAADLAAARDGRPILIVDLAVPRDVEPAAAEVAGVTIVDLNGLREVTPPSPEHLADLARVHALVAEEADRFVVWRKIHAPRSLAAFGFEGAS